MQSGPTNANPSSPEKPPLEVDVKEATPKKPQSQFDIGQILGAAARTVVSHPQDTLARRMQVHPTEKNLSVIGIYRALSQRMKIEQTFYKKLKAAYPGYLVNFPYKGIQLVVWDNSPTFRNWIKAHTPQTSSPTLNWFSEGAMIAVGSTALVHPFNVIRTRVSTGHGTYSMKDIRHNFTAGFKEAVARNYIFNEVSNTVIVKMTAKLQEHKSEPLSSAEVAVIKTVGGMAGLTGSVWVDYLKNISQTTGRKKNLLVNVSEVLKPESLKRAKKSWLIYLGSEFTGLFTYSLFKGIINNKKPSEASVQKQNVKPA